MTREETARKAVENAVKVVGDARKRFAREWGKLTHSEHTPKKGGPVTGEELQYACLSETFGVSIGSKFDSIWTDARPPGFAVVWWVRLGAKEQHPSVPSSWSERYVTATNHDLDAAIREVLTAHLNWLIPETKVPLHDLLAIEAVNRLIPPPKDTPEP